MTSMLRMTFLNLDMLVMERGRSTMPDWVEIVFRTLAAIAILFILTKVLGKRQISELSLFEYITGISIGNIAAYVSLDLDNLWYLGIVSLVVWVAVSVGIEIWTLKNKRVRDFVDGKGAVLIRDGKLLKERLRKERLTLDELLEQLRQKDIYRVADVEFAVMEPNGELNVKLRKEHEPLTPDMLGWKMSKESYPHTIIMDGQILREELEMSQHDEAWVSHELKRHKLKLEDIFLSQINSDGDLIFQTVDGRNIPSESTKPKDKIASLTAQLQQELIRLEKLARNEVDRKTYQSAKHHLEQSIEAMRVSQVCASPKKLE